MRISLLLLGSLALVAGFTPSAARQQQQQQRPRKVWARPATRADDEPGAERTAIARRGALALGAAATIAALPPRARALGFELKDNPQNLAVVGAVQGVLDANPFTKERQEERAKKKPSEGGSIQPASTTPRKSSKDIMDEINRKRNGPNAPRPAPGL